MSDKPSVPQADPSRSGPAPAGPSESVLARVTGTVLPASHGHTVADLNSGRCSDPGYLPVAAAQYSRRDSDARRCSPTASPGRCLLARNAEVLLARMPVPLIRTQNSKPPTQWHSAGLAAALGPWPRPSRSLDESPRPPH